MNKKRQEIIKNASLSHRESLRKSLNNRLEAARVNGNDKLVKQLEAEAKYLHL
ncbi:arginine synthesis PII-interacting regulator PirA [Waterburya agarophytonicola]